MSSAKAPPLSADVSLDFQDSAKTVPLSLNSPKTTVSKEDCQLLSPKKAKKLAKYIKDSIESPNNDKSTKKAVDLERYERMLLLLTQVGYLPVAASMLSTTFFEPSKHFCHLIINRTYDLPALQFKAFESGEFYSLLFEWQEICINSSWMVRISTAVMVGAVLGAFSAGFLADFFGRKPVVVCSLLCLTLANITLVMVGSVSPVLALFIFFWMGCASGGYMVTNVVFIIEAVKSERERLVVASLNGWPIGMLFTAIVSYLAKQQKLYYLITAGTSLVIAALLQLSSFESVGWLTNQNESAKAACVRRQIKIRNNRGNWHNLSLRSFKNGTTCSGIIRHAESDPQLPFKSPELSLKCSKCEGKVPVDKVVDNVKNYGEHTDNVQNGITRPVDKENELKTEKSRKFCSENGQNEEICSKSCRNLTDNDENQLKIDVNNTAKTSKGTINLKDNNILLDNGSKTNILLDQADFQPNFDDFSTKICQNIVNEAITSHDVVCKNDDKSVLNGTQCLECQVRDEEHNNSCFNINYSDVDHGEDRKVDGNDCKGNVVGCNDKDDDVDDMYGHLLRSKPKTTDQNTLQNELQQDQSDLRQDSQKDKLLQNTVTLDSQNDSSDDIYQATTITPTNMTDEDQILELEMKKQSTMTYLDLFKHSTIRRPLIALLYCFLSSSVVSFGFYFNTDYLPGNRYLNLGLMGLLKFTLGLIPFFFSYLISKKLIILLSVGTACACCWSLIAATTILSLNDSIVVTVMGLMVTASMDPTWKISHLYSVELFPTAVRNMARGACNVTARLGSMSGPLIILMRSVNPSLPYWLFAVLLTLQWLVLALFMPSKSADELPESMPNRSKKELKLLENA